MFFKVEYLLNSQRKSIIIEAEDIVQASDRFEHTYEGVLVKITPTTEPLSHKIKQFISSINIMQYKEVNLEEFVSILNQLYVMLDAGIPLLQSLENIQKSIQDTQLKNIFSSIISEIKAGKSFSKAVEPFRETLGIVTISMIDLGEQTGQLAEAIKDLADILEQILDNRQRLKKATRYPIFIIVAMIIAFSIVILMVIPPFQSMFNQLNSELPAPTKFLLLIEHIIRDYGIYILSSGLIGFIILLLAYNKNDKVRLALDKFILKIYIVGDVIFLAMTGRFLFVFEKLVKAGIPINDALDTSIQIIENVYIQNRIKLIKAAIADGRGLAQGFKDTEIFDNIVYQMVESGEQSGALSIMLSKASQYYLKKYRELIDNVSSMIEPILILAIAGFVLVLALGIFLPIWNLQSIAGK